MAILAKKLSYALKREKVLEVAAQLFKERGYRATSIQDIADRLKVTKASLYHYFESKEQILTELYERTQSRLTDAQEQTIQPSDDVRLTLRRVIKNHIAFACEYQDLATIFFQEKAELNSSYRRVVNKRSREYDASIGELLRKGIESGEFKDFDVPVTVNLIMGMCNWVYQWYQRDGRLPAEQIGELAANLVIQGIGREHEAL